MRFSAVAEKVADQRWKSVKDGHRDGRGREVYFRDPVWNRLKEKCEARGISVSRYLQTLAEMSLEGER